MKKFILILLLFTNTVFSQGRLSQSIGDFVDFQKDQNGISITCTNCKILILPYVEDIIRVRITKEYFKKDFSYAVVESPKGEFSEISDNKDNIVLKTKKIIVEVNKKPLRIKFITLDGKIINEDYLNFGVTWLGNEVTCYKKMFSDEKYIGLGEKTGNLDRRGSSYENWNTDDYAYSTKSDPLYKSTPFYIGLHDKLCYGIFFDNTHRSLFNFGASTDEQFMSFSAEDGEMNYYFFGGSSVSEIISNYTYLTGRMKIPPLWSLGYQQCRWSYFPESEVLTLAKTFRDKKIPADVIYFDIHYMDNYKIFTWNKERFPNPKDMLDKLSKLGFHTVVIVDPGIKIENGYFAYEEGVKNDYFVKYPNQEKYIGSVWPGRCHFPDFTIPDVRKWWGSSFKGLVDAGVKGFWNDMNEPAAWGQRIPKIIEFNYDGQKTTLNEARNIYGLQMSRATFEGTKELMNGERPLILTRAAFSGIQRYSAVWTGDNIATDEHMMLGVRLLNSLGLTGIPFAGVDIGGFSGNPTPELFVRWLSIGVYSPFFRGHSQYGMNNKEPWGFGEDNEDLARNMLNQRYRLLPYIYSSFYQSTQTGLPIQRSLAIDYSFDEKIYNYIYQQQYLFGENILVAPTVSTEKYCKVYLPDGGWYRISSDEYYNGKKEVIVESPISDLPVFIKAGGIIPMQTVVQNTMEKPEEYLNLHFYNGDVKNFFIYYEDDGTTYDYEKNKYYKREFQFDPTNKQIKFTKVEGEFASKFKKINLILHNFSNVDKIFVNKTKVEVKKEKENIKSIFIENGIDEILIKY